MFDITFSAALKLKISSVDNKVTNEFEGYEKNRKRLINSS